MGGWLVVERQRAPSSSIPKEFRGLADARPPATLVKATLNLPLVLRKNLYRNCHGPQSVHSIGWGCECG